MAQVIAWLSGKKAIIGTIVLAVIGILAAAGTISLENQWVQIVIVLVTALTGIAFRAAIAKSGPSK